MKMDESSLYEKRKSKTNRRIENIEMKKWTSLCFTHTKSEPKHRSTEPPKHRSKIPSTYHPLHPHSPNPIPPFIPNKSFTYTSPPSLPYESCSILHPCSLSKQQQAAARGLGQVLRPTSSCMIKDLDFLPRLSRLTRLYTRQSGNSGTTTKGTDLLSLAKIEKEKEKRYEEKW